MVEVSVGALGDPVAAEPGGGMPVLELTGELVVAALFADLARDLHRDDDPAATLQRIVDFAVSSVPGAQHAAITTVLGWEFTTVAATDEPPMRVDQVQYETREGPGVDSLLDQEVYRANDLATDTRFPLFAPRAVSRTGVRSMLSFRLFTEEGSLGALNLYATSTGAFTSASVAMGALFAAHASVAMRSARQIEDTDAVADAAAEGQEVPIAVGIVMASTGCTEAEARAVLELAARGRQVDMREVAARVLGSGHPPDVDVSRDAGDPPATHDGEGPGDGRVERHYEGRALVGGVAGLAVALGLVWVFSSSSTQRPLAVLLVPVLGVALVASSWTTLVVALLAVGSGGVLFMTGDPTNADQRLRFLALVVGSALGVVFAVVRERRDVQLREQAGAVAVVAARVDTERILRVMLTRLPELDQAADVDGVARRACPLGRDLFGADHVSYWQVDGSDCVLLSRDPEDGIQAGTRVPRHLFASPPTGPARTRTSWITAAEVSVPTEGEELAQATHAQVGTSTSIQVAGETVAYLGMSWERGRAEPDPSWLDAVDRFADQIALSKTVIRRRQAQREVMAIARRFQAGLLPRIPEQQLLTLHSLYRPGMDQMLLGGDFLDVVVEETAVSFVLGDVAGHGPEQAALGATLRGAWLSVASIPVLRPGDWARALNRVVHDRAPGEGVFVTAVMGRLNLRDATLDYVSAGHPPPILLLPNLTAAPLGDTVLGIDTDIEFTEHHLELGETWAVLLVTDGLFEGHLPGAGDAHGNYDDFVTYLGTCATNDLASPTWLTDLADTLERANAGPLRDDAAALLLLPHPAKPPADR